MFGRNRTSALTYLTEKSEFQGNLHVEGNLRVDGVIHGTVEVRGDMEVSHTGLVEGPELHTHNLVIQGVVKARIVAQGRLSLAKTARLEGDVTAQSIDIEAGAFYLGHITTADAAERALPGTGNLPELVGREPS
ncbi:MAG: polymer-forming cytoskeletal protein [Cyanobacteria bacterium J06638_20]